MTDPAMTAMDGGMTAQLDKAVQWNINVVRLPIYPSDAMHGDTAGMTFTSGWNDSTAETYFNDYIDPTVQYAKSKGLYVIIDWHYITDVNSSSASKTNTEAFWAMDQQCLRRHRGIIPQRILTFTRQRRSSI